jgi:peptide/nickel transport system substrate-binding protein
VKKLCQIALTMMLACGIATVHAETPHKGGTLVFGVEAEPPNYDCHQGNTYVILDLVSPIYSELIRFDPRDMSKFEPDLASSWQTELHIPSAQGRPVP